MSPVRAEADGAKKRSEVVTVRLDPRLKYLAEIAARKQRRTLSGYIEWAVEQSLDRVQLREGADSGYGVTVADAQNMYDLWDVDEAVRVLRLALHFPELLTYDEQLVWRLIRDNGYVWKGRYSKSGEWEWSTDSDSLIWDRARSHWDIFKQVAADQLTKDNLPAWARTKPSESGVSGLRPAPDLDDEMPF
jgi:predicted transcriptional regulator